MARNPLEDLSHYGIKRRMGIAPDRVDGIGPPSAPPAEHAHHGGIAPTSRHMQHHKGEPIYSNTPELSTPRGQLDHPVEAQHAGAGSMDKPPFKSGPAWGASTRILHENAKQHAPGKRR